MLLAGPEPYDRWDESIIEDLHKKAKNKKDKSDKERENKNGYMKIVVFIAFSRLTKFI